MRLYRSHLPRRMRNALAAAAACCLLVVPGGCRRRAPEIGIPGDTIELPVKNEVLVIEIASDELSRRLGLMQRTSLPENMGMLFIFPDRAKQSFWMKNTLIPLSAAFLDDNGKILQIENMRPKDESSTVSNTLVRYALEVNQGWFERHGVGVGDSFAGFADKVRRFQGRR